MPHGPGALLYLSQGLLNSEEELLSRPAPISDLEPTPQVPCHGHQATSPTLRLLTSAGP